VCQGAREFSCQAWVDESIVSIESHKCANSFLLMNMKSQLVRRGQKVRGGGESIAVSVRRELVAIVKLAS